VDCQVGSSFGRVLLFPPAEALLIPYMKGHMTELWQLSNSLLSTRHKAAALVSRFAAAALPADAAAPADVVLVAASVPAAVEIAHGGTLAAFSPAAVAFSAAHDPAL